MNVKSLCEVRIVNFSLLLQICQRIT